MIDEQSWKSVPHLNIPRLSLGLCAEVCPLPLSRFLLENSGYLRLRASLAECLVSQHRQPQSTALHRDHTLARGCWTA
jgi:hypothetical protein